MRSLNFARPVIDLRALAIRNFSLGWWVSFVTGIGIFTTVYLTPLFLGRVCGLLRRMSPVVALNRRANRADECPVSGVDQKTYARSEPYRF